MYMLSSFQSTVIYVGIVIFILIFIFIALRLYFSNNNYVYPPVIPSCPDYWEDLSTGKKGSKCVNKKNLGKCGNDDMNFTTSKWIGHRGMCNKNIWANSCGITWDGISNTYPCDKL